MDEEEVRRIVTETMNERLLELTARYWDMDTRFWKMARLVADVDNRLDNMSEVLAEMMDVFYGLHRQLDTEKSK